MNRRYSQCLLYRVRSNNGVLLSGRTGVTVKNLNVKNFACGINLYSCTSNTLTGNTASNNYFGIGLGYSSGNTLTGNTASNNYYGIGLGFSSGNTLIGNTASNSYCGIYLGYSSSNTLTSNTASNNEYSIFLPFSNSNTLSGNTVSDNYIGISLYCCSGNSLTSNAASNNAFAISLWASSGNTLSGNGASNDNYYGICLLYSDDNMVTANTVSNNACGINLSYSSGNTLTGNTANSNRYTGVQLWVSNSGNTLTGNTVSANNMYGIYLYDSGDNEIYNNNFISNPTQAYVDASTGNVFNLDKPIGGNFWSDWRTPDGNPEDGFVDYPYEFTGGVDYLPWAIPDGWVNKPPVADAGINLEILSVQQASTVVCGTGSDPDEDPLQYRWVEGETILLDWADLGASGEAYLDLGTVPPFSVGNHTLTLEVREVREGGLRASDDMILAIENSPPEVQPSPIYQTVQIGMDPIVVVADVSDFDGDTLTYQWLKGSEVLASGSVQAPVGGGSVLLPNLEIAGSDPRFLLGVHSMELRVRDGVNDPVSKFVSVEVIDTTAPSLSPVPNVAILWPPDHKMRFVTIWANAFDNGGGAIQLSVTVASSEPPDAGADGKTIPDYYIDSVDSVTGLIELQLRSERAGTGDGRTYTITITATDASGNQSVAVVEILAPHDKRKQ